jgi:hypothetical protein
MALRSAAMTIVSVASLATLGSYYVFFYGASRLSAVPRPYLLEQSSHKR